MVRHSRRTERPTTGIHRITSLPRRLYYKTKRAITPRRRDTTTTRPTTTGHRRNPKVGFPWFNFPNLFIKSNLFHNF